jgi:hypothetical protein
LSHLNTTNSYRLPLVITTLLQLVARRPSFIVLRRLEAPF